MCSTWPGWKAHLDPKEFGYSRSKIIPLGIDLVVSHGIAYPLPTGVNEKIVRVNEKIHELARGMKS